ncbi:uncharacterized protein LOC110846606 [Folsomia candida]|uniref:uncharacterized protein LOC110846606 n=1 Tax=Folsomia candida TaxID=158441 RepID=UPI000B90253D|nr:uncharacterized protein LOC110846606 [Folsomia candida]
MEARLIRWKTVLVSRQLEIFTYINLIWSLLEFSIIFTNYPWISLGFLSRFFMSWILIWAHRKKHATACKIWCIFEAVMIVIILTLGLCKVIKFTKVASDKDAFTNGKMFSISKPRLNTPAPSPSMMRTENEHRLNNYICENDESQVYSDKCPLNNIIDENECRPKLTLSGSEVQYSIIYTQPFIHTK